MTKTEYTEKIETIIQDSHDCAEWSCWDQHEESTNDILSLLPDLVRSFLPEKIIENAQEDQSVPDMVYFEQQQNIGFNDCLDQIEDRLKTWESEGK